MFTAGLILDSVSRARAEQLRIHYMSLPLQAGSSVTGETRDRDKGPSKSARRGAQSAA
jgi:hypothetical protein